MTGPYGPAAHWAGWWFAEPCDVEDGGTTRYLWRPVLQLDGMALPLAGVWFGSRAECLEFVRDNVIPRAGVTHV